MRIDKQITIHSVRKMEAAVIRDRLGIISAPGSQ